MKRHPSSLWSYVGMINTEKNDPLNIIALVSKSTGVSVLEMHKKCRNREIVKARQIAMWIMKQQTKLNLAEIGAYFNGKDHATVIHANKTINNLISNGKDKYGKLAVKILNDLLKEDSLRERLLENSIS